MNSNDDLMDILNDLARTSLYSNDEEAMDIYSAFNNIYSDKNFRHSYFEISQLLEDLVSDERDILEYKLEKITIYISENFSSSGILKNVLKLLDHVSLEMLRLARIEKVNYVADKSNTAMNEAMTVIKETKLNVEEADNKLKNIHSETITTLGIFSGLVIGFATSFQLLAQSFSNLNDIYFYKIICYLAVIGIILFNCIFFLMFSVARISGRSLATNCKFKDCANCDESPCKTPIGKLHKKFPYVFWYNIAMIALLIVSALWEFFTRK